MRWVGDGDRNWFVRVEHFVDEQSADTTAAFEALSELLEGDGRGHGVDQGTGMTSGGVLGLTFVVRADDPITATGVALDTAAAALESRSIGLYGVTVIADTR